MRGPSLTKLHRVDPLCAVSLITLALILGYAVASTIKNLRERRAFSPIQYDSGRLFEQLLERWKIKNRRD